MHNNLWQTASLQGGILATTTGLKKDVNEDQSSVAVIADAIRFCVADGHWGAAAAERCVAFWTSEALTFPHIRENAVKLTLELEQLLYAEFGTQDMDENRDFTPEAAFIAGEISGDKITLVSYGDCRAMLIRSRQILYSVQESQTWLGAFSHLGLRNRQAVTEGLVFDVITRETGDTFCVFTDGIDECVYETPTLSRESIAELISDKPIEQSIQSLMEAVDAAGAEDNATVLIVQ